MALADDSCDVTQLFVWPVGERERIEREISDQFPTLAVMDDGEKITDPAKLKSMWDIERAK